MTSMEKLTGSLVLVTGASAGIGEAFAHAWPHEAVTSSWSPAVLTGWRP